jgi:hypothetical protein
MTNFLAAIIVTLVTNVVESSNESGCSTCAQLRRNPYLLIYHQTHPSIDGAPFRPATERYEIITVTRNRRLVAKEQDIDILLSADEVSSVTKIKRLESKWVDYAIRTNSPVVMTNLTWTNITNLTNLWILTNVWIYK